MAYITMSRLITNENNKLANGQITREEYEVFKDNTQNKLDVFMACNRLTLGQYGDLIAMFVEDDQ